MHPATSQHFRAIATAVALLLACTTPLRAQATATVDPADPVYRVIARLAAERMIDTAIVGQQPYSRRAVARMLVEASRNRSRASASPVLLALLDRERARFKPEIDAVVGDHGRSWKMSLPVDRLTVETALLSSSSRGIPGAGLGNLTASTNPLVDNHQGRPYASGNVTLGAEAATRLQLGRFAAVSFTPTVRGPVTADFRPGAFADVYVLAGSTLLRNLRLDVGKDYVSWGQTPTGGLATSWNALPLLQLRIASDVPFVLPWFLRRLGPMRGTFSIADLGTDAQRFDHSQWIAYKVSIEPHPRFELGVAVVDEMGGSGAPKASFGKRVADVVPLVDVVFMGESDLQFSNKLAGADVRWRVPSARGLELYAESMLDDFDARRLKSSLWEDNGIIAGFVLPRLSASGVWSLEGEAHHTGLRYYEHPQFQSGLTYNARVIGDPLGPRANAGYLTLGWEPDAVNALQLRGAYEWRSNDQYRITATGPNDEGFGFVRTQVRPKEKRVRLTVNWAYTPAPFGLRLMAEGGLERVANFLFLNGEDRTNGLLRFGVEYRP
jgi:hypothetical protein